MLDPQRDSAEHEEYAGARSTDRQETEETDSADLLERILAYLVSEVGHLFSASSVQKYLKHENRSISLDLLLDIADGLGIDLSMLFVLDRKEEEYWESVTGNELK